jgi:hypothetical protein
LRERWSTYQSEWAIDLVFRDAADLRRLYPRLVHHGMMTFSSPDVMRYLGKRISLSGDVPRGFSGEVVSDLKHRQEGMRIKHSVNGSSLKLYDKAFTVVGRVLRAEATVHHGDDFRVYRPKEGDPQGEMAWRQMRDCRSAPPGRGFPQSGRAVLRRLRQRRRRDLWFANIPSDRQSCLSGR